MKSRIMALIGNCKNMKSVKKIHAKIITDDIFYPYQTSLALSKLLNFCAVSPHGSLDYAKNIFNELKNPRLSLYNIIIRGLSLSNEPLEAVVLYKKILENGLYPNNFTYPFVIKACCESSVSKCGVLVHTHVVKFGLECDCYIQSTLIHLYVSREDLVDAKKVFDVCSKEDTVCWNGMIDGYVKAGDMVLGREVFERMVCKDVISWNTMINGYGIIGEIDEAKRLFDDMPVRNIVSWNTMLSAYVKCGKVEDALKLFHELPYRDVISWNAMLACYAQTGKSNEALALYDDMKRAGLRPTEATVVSLLSACGHLGALDKGLQFHSCISENKIEINSIVGTALVEMYAKCGSIANASKVFNSMKSKDILAWNTIITGMAMHGHVKEAQQLFKEMVEDGVAPDDITFVAMLSAFRHAGMVEEGRKLLDCMSNIYGIEPKVEHYGSVIDLLSRTGHVQDALDLIKTMPMEPNACAWGALLGGCRIYGNSEMGQQVGKHLIDLQPEHSGRYVLLSNIYAAAKRWDDVKKVRDLMKSKGIKKVPGASVIELKGTVHRFVAGDSSHPESKQIYEKWAEISTQLQITDGYAPDTDQVLVDIQEEEKENALSVHSEKLAIAYGFLHLDSHEPIRIVKNLRVCRDCHDVTKLISRRYGREIIVRDRNRFHHFKNGVCSCKDFW
ncbi:Pentatricopeptide repeat-containing protein [Heracleum sosnowskyi]|uniref:Pentatricopeptide repeat-containing protein n=1 Tax=Heracleum sosnowskyi TaxID=360622 RepID=A0AAD8IJ83_9APIA|nr:Pentatricopeptide repeat-containing protein [Heracleum sosnowskyi]